MTNQSDEVDPGIEGFERLRAAAAASGIEQDVPLDRAKFLASLDDSSPAALTVGELRTVSDDVRTALVLAESAAAQLTSDQGGELIQPIVAALQRVVVALSTSSGRPR